MLEKPKIMEYISDMSMKLADTLKISSENISIKAKTNEGMGFIGRQEGVAAYAVVTMTKKGDE
jgi:2-C-methyl-D-erythritol 2,4-cyclodiphosphate synthase